MLDVEDKQAVEWAGLLLPWLVSFLKQHRNLEELNLTTLGNVIRPLSMTDELYQALLGLKQLKSGDLWYFRCDGYDMSPIPLDLYVPTYRRGDRPSLNKPSAAVRAAAEGTSE